MLDVKAGYWLLPPQIQQVGMDFKYIMSCPTLLIFVVWVKLKIMLTIYYEMTVVSIWYNCYAHMKQESRANQSIVS